MRFHLTPEPLLYLITTFLLAPQPIAANPHPITSSLAGFSFNELFARWDCDSGTKCGYYDQLCCQAGSACWTNAKTQAECTPASSGAGSISAAASYSAAPSASARCSYALSDTPCGNACCSQTTTASSGAVPGVKGTSHSGVVVTRTAHPSTTIPYETPVATGANITMTEINGGSSLSGGAIAGIVVGVLIGLLILGVICFYCCLKGIWDGCLAIFGVDRRRKVTEVDEYTRRTHHSSGGDRRTWYGGGPTRRKEERRDSHLGRDLLGMGAGLAGLWAILGLKRRRDNRRNDEKYSEYSISSDYYTSESE